MECPYCKKEVILPEYVYRNIKAYHNTVKHITDCCGKILYVEGVIKFKVTLYTGSLKEDDWGNTIKEK